MTVVSFLRLLVIGVLLLFVWDEAGPATVLVLALMALSIEGLAEIVRQFSKDRRRDLLERTERREPGVRLSLFAERADASLSRAWKERHGGGI